MPTKAKSTKTSKPAEKNIISDSADNTATMFMSLPERIISMRPNKTIYLILLAIGIVLLFIFKKDWFIAATVNNTPITNLELQQKLNQQFKSQTLNQMINEKIILQEAAKSGVAPTQQEIDQKISEIETKVGGKDAMGALLTQQNTTLESLKNQIRLELIVSKLYEKEATVSAEEVQKFIEENKQMLQSTDSASLEKEAEETLKQQKLTQIFSEKFQEIRQKANIKIF